MNIKASNGVMNVGHQLDNLATVISFPVGDVISDQGAGGSWSVRIQRSGDVAAYPTSNFSVSNNNLNLILTSSDLAVVGEGQIQIKYTVGSKVLMSRVYRFYSHYSLDASATTPEPWVSWVDEVEANADRAEEAVEHYPYIDSTTKHWMQWDVDEEEFVDTDIVAEGQDGQDGQDGEDGEDGVSPTVTISTITGGHRITIVDAQGTHTADVMDGADGQPGADGEDGEDGEDGYSPTVEITTITGGHRITITDKTGAHTADVMDGETPSLTNYYTKSQTDDLLDDKVNITEISVTAVGTIGIDSSGLYWEDDDE